jgi:chromosome segregation protein
MKLLGLEMTGFKSFAARTRLTLPPGVTAVVGPNGCGKSNIVDAVRWALGEQSPRSLRGNAMEDVIFNGSQHKRPVSLAQVSVQLETAPLPGTTEPTFLKVGRRLYRSGKSEYLMDGKTCRLRDIQEAFMDTGVGGEAYAIIEQGKVDELIRARPEERRLIIEEAAGITRYRAKRKSTEANLEKTRENLLRVNDIFQEVSEQHRRLAIQAERARRWQELERELREKEFALAVRELVEENLRVAKLRQRAGVLNAALDKARQAHARAEEAEQRLRATVAERKEGLADARRDMVETGTSLQHSREERRAAEVRSEEDKARRTRAKGELHRLGQGRREKETELENRRRLLREEQQSYNEQERTLNEWEQKTAALREQMAATRQTLQERRRQSLALLDERSRLRNEQTRLETQRQGLDARKERLDQEHAENERAAGVQKTTVRETEEVLSRLEESRRALLAQRQDLNRRLETQRQLKEQGSRELRAARDQLTKLRSRWETLRELKEQRQDFGQATRVLSETGSSPQSPFRLRGLLADALEVAEEFLPALEAVLEDRFQGVLVESAADAQAAAELLAGEDYGRTTVFPLPLHQSTEASLPADEPGVVGALVDCVTVEAGLAEALAPLFAGVVVVEDLATARRLGAAHPGAHTWVTRRGEVWAADGSLRAGRGRSIAGEYLSRKKEIAELAGSIEKLAAKGETLEQNLAAAESELTTLLEESRRLESREQGLQIEIAQQKKELEQVRREFLRTSKFLEAIDLERRQIAAQHKECEADWKRLLEASLDAEQQRTAAERECEALNSRLEQLQAKVEAQSDRATEAKMRLTAGKERLLSLQNALHAGKAELAELERRIAQEQRNVEELDASIGQAAQLCRELTGRLKDLEHRKLALSRKIEELSGSLAAAEERLVWSRDDVREARCTVAAAQKEAQAADVELASRSGVLERLSEDFEVRFGQTIEEVPEEARQGTDDLQAMRSRIHDLKQQLAGMGTVNLEAIEEFKEVEERYLLYKQQIGDLEEATQRLHVALEKINKVCRERFRETFEAVNRNFSEVFSNLFRGGTARMELVGGGEVLDAGIEIVVQPPGKKLQRLTLLSGGEKALVTLALLVSIFLHRPSPFCILDEVDASLDDANIGRFNRLLVELAGHTQLLVITHNQHTMTAADTLHGITMEEPGVSKLVSVSLNDGAVPRREDEALNEATSAA